MAVPDPTPAASGPEPDLSGRDLGDYRLLRRLGRGAMAEVYLAEQRSLERQVAFKVLKADLARDGSYVRRFHHEARAAASLVHAGIVQIYEVGCIEGVHFIAQEYIRGQNLRQLLRRHGPVDAPLAVAIMRQVAAALHKAREHRIVHRDIKPDNIMLSSGGEVKVADFGLARVDSPGAVALTQVGVTMGTPLYMSPEQTRGDRLDCRSDIYSFGVTCYHMLAGRPPFEGDTALNVAVQHLKSEPERLEHRRPDLPGGLCRIVHKMLAKDVADRYQQPAELLQDLRALRIDGPSDDWSSGDESWGAAELIALTDARLEATERLDALMKTAVTRVRRRRRWWVLPAACIAGALLSGAAAAWITRAPYLLTIDRSDRENQPQVDRKETAEAQYVYAAMIDTEDAWKSVGRYFPKNEYYSRRAKQQLARLYLREDRLELAMPIFTELAELDPAEVEFRAFGLAGQAIVYARSGQRRLAAEKVADVIPLERHLELETEMRREIEELKQGWTQTPPKSDPTRPNR